MPLQYLGKIIFLCFSPELFNLKLFTKIQQERAYPLIHEMTISKPLEFKANLCLSFSNRKSDDFWNRVTLKAAVLSGKRSR